MRKTLPAILLLVAIAAAAAAALTLLRVAPGGSPGASGSRREVAAAPSLGRSLLAPSPATRPPGAPPRSGDAKAPAAPVWSVDKAASRLGFRAVMDGQPFDGVFRDWDAQIAFDPHNLKGSRATITVDTPSALTGQPIKDQALPNSEWLSTAKYPTASLVTRQIVQTGPGHYTATADVNIRGVRWRTSVPFTVVIARDTGRMQATLTLDRRTFGIGEGPFDSPAPVAPAVQVTMRLVAKKGR